MKTVNLVDSTETMEWERNKGYKVSFKQIYIFIIITNANACHFSLVQHVALSASKTVSAADTTLISTSFFKIKENWNQKWLQLLVAT